MRTSLNWIKDLVPGLDAEPQEFCDAMTMSGSKVEFYETFDKDLKNIVVGRIDEIKKHPDADHLVICKVNIGDREIQIVTGAPNAKEGMLTPVVLPGGKVAGSHNGEKTPGGIEIKAGKLRGIESDGMMCSIEELGQTRDLYPEAPESGLYEFDTDSGVKPGDDAIEALGLHDTAVEYEITSNRVDCFSVLGLAREAAATFGLKKRFPEVHEVKGEGDINDYISVEVNDSLCKRYIARAVKDIRLAPSPAWMQKRLRAQGIRPINNIVDITNYVMVEYGQPMHAYDLDTIKNHKIRVARANDGETFRTLDGQDRQLDHDILMINDGEKPIGIAGIMGGENSMITDNVTTMLFESACFDGTNIRLSSKRLGLRTDASSIFEKGLDPNNAINAMNRACDLIEELGAGTVIGGVIDIYPEKKEGRRIPFEPDVYNRRLGTNVTREEMLSYFKNIDLDYDESTNEIVVPSWRQDLINFADMSEEVARFYGYNNIPTTLPKGTSTTGKLSYKMRIEKIARDLAQYIGFSQAMVYSFESPKVFDKLLIPADSPLRKCIEIANPLGEDFSIMRTISLNGILTSLSTNYNRRNKSVRLYEMGNIYIPKSLPLKELPDERMTLTFGMYGDGDFYDMKGVVEELMERMGINDKIKYDQNSDRPYLHPGRHADIIVRGQVVGYLGEVHPLVCRNYSIGERVIVAVIDMPWIVKMASFDKKYTGIVNFPASARDLSLVCPADIQAGDVEEVFDRLGGEYLESYKLFDLYEGDRIEKGKKSLAYTLTFRAKDRNLSDSDVNSGMDSIITGLAEKGITLRK